MQHECQPRVSVIVASHRQNAIESFLAAWGNAIWGTVPVEIIVVADYPVDTFQKRYQWVQWFYVSEKSIPMKRNKGVRHAQGDICAFIDDDCRPCSGWISRAAAFLDANQEYAGVEGKTVIEKKKGMHGAYREYKRLEQQGFRTNNIFYRKSILCSVGMFDERFTVQREDVDLAYTLIENGFSIAYEPMLRVEHQFRDTEQWDLLKNCINRRFDPLLCRKHPALYRTLIKSPFPPSLIYALMIQTGVFCSIFTAPSYSLYAAGCGCAALVILTIRRGGFLLTLQWFRELGSYMIAPFLLLVVLLYGSIRYRYLLVF